MADTAIERIEELAVQIGQLVSKKMAPTTVIGFANEIYMQCENLREAGWISTEERMPEDMERVLIARLYEKDGPLLVEQGYRYGGGWWKVYGSNLRDKSVPYWRPMPDAPRWPL